MTADELLNEWIVKTEFPRWAKTRLRWWGMNVPMHDTVRRKLSHLYQCPTLKADHTNHEWECACYSEYTRDDSWVIHAKMVCAHDPEGIDWYIEPGSVSLPEVLQGMAELDKETFDYCPYKED